MTGHESLWHAINELREKFDARLRRVEYAVIALVVTTASPKLGGPSLSHVTTAIVNTLGTAGSIALGVAVGALGLLASLKNYL